MIRSIVQVSEQQEADRKNLSASCHTSAKLLCDYLDGAALRFFVGFAALRPSATCLALISLA
jgi:hypothetical protein